MLFIHEKFLVYKLETFENCKEVKHIIIMIIAIIYIFLILCDIWSTVENYFHKILPPLKKYTHPLFKNSKIARPRFANIEKFLGPQIFTGFILECLDPFFLLLFQKKK